MLRIRSPTVVRWLALSFDCEPALVSRRHVAWAVAAVVAACGLAFVLSQLFAVSNQPEGGTDATGMYLVSLVVWGAVLLGLVCVSAWLALRREQSPCTGDGREWTEDAR